MSDKRQHRGAHPEDHKILSPDQAPELAVAVRHLCWLLSRGYALPSSLKLVGDRFNLVQRQRIAVSRASCSDEQLHLRKQREVPPEQCADEVLWIDGYNLLTTIEAALSGGFILACRDGCYRDMASMHGTWRRVQETLPALELIGETFAKIQVAGCRWLFDKPVSNSGRLATSVRELAEQRGWNWEVELENDPDGILAANSEALIITHDSGILDRCRQWVNLSHFLICEQIPNAWVLDLSGTEETPVGSEE